ncbi:bicyclomycin resistance protein [Aaosphaeria arxii CBS 175.79]|uniref:Bicyclomycin resistance protein n=1 Tax=Aaosphaeria arxii CBS 175.79 TaxID=1450172 RepID=A0A6A5XDV2_9PLEO|nr:bicyclomycin resistance protein [Aaosphaeria arxii CBS 175.79]KAF2011060.1 bicyclomycin resistance protein [Aaosphaeria arxii CBS 175.79]
MVLQIAITTHHEHSSPTVSFPNLLLEWDRHPGNARNWSTFRKVYTIAIVSVIGFVSTIATSMYSPGHQDVAREFGVSETMAMLPLSFYALGLAFGPMLGSPMSETFGRKIVYLSTIPAFAMFILGSGLSKSIASLCVCRFFAGFFAAPGVSIATATIADTVAPDGRGVPLAIYFTMPFVGSLLGPVIGGLVSEWKGWRWTQWTTLFFAATAFPLLGFVHESYRGVLLQRIAKREGIGSSEHSKKLSNSLRAFFTKTVSRPVHMLFTEPIVGFVCLYCSFQFALLYTFIVGMPYVFSHTYGFSAMQQSLSFLGLTIGAILAGITLVIMDYYVYQSIHRRFRVATPNGFFPPEHRLYPAMLGSCLLPIGLFFFAWTARSDVTWVVSLLAQCVTMLGSILAYVSVNMYMLDTYGPLYGASAAGASSLARYVLTACFPLFTLHMYKSLGTNWTASLLGFCTLAMAPIPLVFWKWGARLRARSCYEMEL